MDPAKRAPKKANRADFCSIAPPVPPRLRGSEALVVHLLGGGHCLQDLSFGAAPPSQGRTGDLVRTWGEDQVIKKKHTHTQVVASWGGKQRAPPKKTRRTKVKRLLLSGGKRKGNPPKKKVLSKWLWYAVTQLGDL